MRTITIGVWSLDEVKDRVATAADGLPQHRHVGFASASLMWAKLSQKRWDILQLMVGQDAMSIRELARRLGRDVKAVHGDVVLLLDAQLIEKSAEGKIVFPYDKIDVRFSILPASDAAA